MFEYTCSLTTMLEYKYSESLINTTGDEYERRSKQLCKSIINKTRTCDIPRRNEEIFEETVLFIPEEGGVYKYEDHKETYGNFKHIRYDTSRFRDEWIVDEIVNKINHMFRGVIKVYEECSCPFHCVFMYTVRYIRIKRTLEDEIEIDFKRKFDLLIEKFKKEIREELDKKFDKIAKDIREISEDMKGFKDR